MRYSMLHSPTYLPLALVLLAVGCAIIYFWYRPTA